MIHLKTIALVIALVMAAWLFGLLPADAQIVSGSGSSLPSASGTGQCLNSVAGGSNSSVWGTCGSGNLPALGTAGQVLSINSGGSAAAWASCSGDVTCSALTPGAMTVNGTGGVPFATSATTDTTNASNISSGTLAAARGGAGTVSGILKGNGVGVVSAAISGTDFQSPIAGNTLTAHNFATSINTSGVIGGAQPACGDLSNGAASCSTDTTNASNISSGTLAAARGGAGAVNGILKANGSGAVSQAVSSTDYAPATSGSSILKGNAAGGFSNAVSGTDYQAPIAGNTLAAHNFASSISTAGTISGAQPAFSDLSGSVASTQMPALTGDTTTSAGSTVTTTSAINGGTIPLSATALSSNASHQIVAATVQGNGAKVQLSTGTTTTNDCAKFDANGNVVDNGAGCGGATSPNVTALVAAQTVVAFGGI